MSKQVGFLGIDQYGTHYNIKKYPRKELCEQLYSSHASKMYVDTKNGNVKEVGYIIKGLWINVYRVCSWK